jgi:putative sterol carrier protein
VLAGRLIIRLRDGEVVLEPGELYVVIRDGAVRVERGLIGTPNLHLTDDSATWVRFLRKETKLLWAVLRGKLRWKGSPQLLRTFAACFAT